MTEPRQSGYRRRANDGSGTAVSIRDMVLDHNREIEDLQTFRAEVKGAISLAKWAMGAGVLSAVVSVIGIILAVAHAIAPTIP